MGQYGRNSNSAFTGMAAEYVFLGTHQLVIVYPQYMLVIFIVAFRDL